MGFELLGFTRRATSREDLKFQFRFHHLVLGKFEWTHSQPGDTQYDVKAGSFPITGRINTEGKEEDSPRWLTQQKWSELEYCSLYDSLVFTYDTSSFSSWPGWEMPTILLPATLPLFSEKVPKVIKAARHLRIFWDSLRVRARENEFWEKVTCVTCVTLVT